MVLQKVMKQGSVHGIPSHDACSDFTKSRMCGHVGGGAFLLHFCFEVVTGVHIRYPNLHNIIKFA